MVVKLRLDGFVDFVICVGHASFRGRHKLIWLAATSIGRIGLENLALGRAFDAQQTFTVLSRPSSTQGRSQRERSLESCVTSSCNLQRFVREGRLVDPHAMQDDG